LLWIFLVVGFLAVFGIAAITIGRETHRLDAVTPVPTVDINDAVEWISEELPDDVSAQVSYEDVRDILLWHVDEMQNVGVISTGGSEGEAIVVDEHWSIDAIAHRALAEGRVFAEGHIRAVLDAELKYFDAIGAVGPRASSSDADLGSGA
jgi:hypothetical protein